MEDAINRRFHAENPVLIPYTPGQPTPPPAKPPLTLSVTEYASLVDFHHVHMSLFGSSLGLENRKWMIIDRNPFLIALVDFPNFSPTESSGAELATWDSGDPRDPDQSSGWRLYTGKQQAANVRFPAQAIGETMVKNSQDLKDGYPVDYRFSPAALVQIRTSSSNYTLPPWNLRRLFGTSGQLNPGAELLSLHTELLYGLSTDVNTPDPNAANLPLRIAEFGARMGAVPGCLPLAAGAGGSSSNGCPAPASLRGSLAGGSLSLSVV